MKTSKIWSIMMMLVVVLFSALSFTSCGGDDDDDPVAPVIDKNFSVSPTDLSMLAPANSTVSFTITTNRAWTISGTPEWLNLSAKSGEGNATITVTALEPNNSSETRTATITVASGDETKNVTISQKAMYESGTSIRFKERNKIILSDGCYIELEFDDKVLGFKGGYYNAKAFETKSKEIIYNEIKNDAESYSKVDYDHLMLSGMDPSTEYKLCVIGYTGGDVTKYGPMEVYTIKTKSSSYYCDAAIGSITYNSSKWSYTISKQQRCHHYYKLNATNSSADHFYLYSPYIELAYYIQDRINDPNYPNYDYYLNDGTITHSRTSDDTSFYVWTWGIDDNNEFSGNVRDQYKSTTSSLMYSNAKEEVHTLHVIKKTKKELKEASKKFSVSYVK